MGSCSSYPMVWLSRVQVSGILLYFVQDKLEKDVASFQTGILCVFPCWIVWCVSDATVICRIPLGLCGQKSYNIKCAKMVPSRKFKHKFCLYLLTGFIHFNSCSNSSRLEVSFKFKKIFLTIYLFCFPLSLWVVWMRIFHYCNNIIFK